MNKDDLSYKAKLYKIRLVEAERDCFGNYVSSDKWDEIVKAMDDDLNKRKLFKFVHPQASDKVYIRHYMGCPVNGNALITVGQHRTDMDFAYIRITLRSLRYKIPYLVLENYPPAFRNPDILAEMVSCAFNWALEKQGLKVLLEPWDTKSEIVHWLKDSWDSYLYEQRTNPNVMYFGFEDAWEYFKKYQDKKNKKQKPKANKKSDEIKDYLPKKHDKERLLAWLDEELKGKKNPKDIMRPIRFLEDKDRMKRQPFDAIDKRYHIAGLISVSSFNYYANKGNDCFYKDEMYDDMEKNFDYSM